MTKRKKTKQQKRTRRRTQSGKVVLYQRVENRRWYADLSAYPVEVRGRLAERVALKAEGCTSATQDATEAVRLAEVIERDLLLTDVAQRSGDANAQQKSTTFTELVRIHLEAEDKRKKLSPRHRTEVEQRMGMAADYFGERAPEGVTAADVEAYWHHLAELPRDHLSAKRYGWEPRAATTLRPQSVIHYLNALSLLYGTASKGRYVPKGYNPVHEADRPELDDKEAQWLTVNEAATVLDTARTMYADRSSDSVPFMYEVVAVLLLTGVDLGPVRTMEIGHIDFENRTVRVPFKTRHRDGLKNKHRARTIPLWGQLAEILEAYIPWRLENLPGDRLLFPEPRDREVEEPKHKDFSTGPFEKIQAAVEAAHGADFFEPAAERIMEEEFRLRSKGCRHTYCVARLGTFKMVTTQAGEVMPMATSRDEVAREMGHGGSSMVEKVYGHQTTNDPRAVVEYRLGPVLYSKTGSENSEFRKSLQDNTVPVAQLDRATAS